MMKPETLRKIKKVEQIMREEGIPATQAVRRAGVSIQTWYARNKPRNRSADAPKLQVKPDALELVRAILASQLGDSQKILVLGALVGSPKTEVFKEVQQLTNTSNSEELFRVDTPHTHPRN